MNATRKALSLFSPAALALAAIVSIAPPPARADQLVQPPAVVATATFTEFFRIFLPHEPRRNGG